VAEAGEHSILVAHSLGCLLVAKWAMQTRQRIHAALLVAVPDPGGPAFPTAATGFAPLPRQPLPFAARMLASSDDRYATPQFSKTIAALWGAELLDVGKQGHLNADSGVADWPAAWELLQAWRKPGPQRSSRVIAQA